MHCIIAKLEPTYRQPETTAGLAHGLFSIDASPAIFDGFTSRMAAFGGLEGL
jgi:hypothetical protein